jgi:hypothetical protein
MWWLLLLLLVALLVMTGVERFTEPAGGFAVVTRPDKSTLWSSKVVANTPFGTEVPPYIDALAAFYDKVYIPAPSRPKESDVDIFVATAYPGTDPVSLKTIIMEAYHIDAAEGKAAGEQKQVKFEPSARLLAPKDGVDEVRVRTEDEYTPADTDGPFTESGLGKLAPTPQTIPSRGERKERELTPVENI